MKRKFLLTAAALFTAVIAFGQQPLPNDPEVKTGKLDNGMTYYIRHNALPEGRAEFYLATNAGAIQETPDQDGLAHFLEHMCFNGLKNLPGKQMLEYLQHIGAEFGRNINASTGVEHTQYMLNNMPVTREGILDTCLLVMHDYSHFVLNDPKEIDAERGVILEEKRTRNTAGWRMFEQSAPYLYGKDSKYASCTVIGSEENLKTFKPSSLETFYKTWYQPDMQALIIIGDIDVEQVYNKVVKLFSDIPAPAQPTVKVMPKVEMNEQPVVGILTDPENTYTGYEIVWKLGEPMPNEINASIQGYSIRALESIIEGVMSERFNDITTKPGAPFIGAGLGLYDLTETCYALTGNLNCENAKALEALKAYLIEVEKAKRYGFTDDEIGRAKEDIIKHLKNKVDGASTRKNPEFVYPIMNNFFNGYPYMTPETELQIAQMLYGQFNAQVINQALPQFLTGVPTIIYQGVDQPGQVHPTEAEVLAVLEEVKNADIQPNKVEAINSDFMAGIKIKPGAVKKAVTGAYGATIWTLKNGLNVVVLPTEYKKDQVIFELTKKGGVSLVPTEDIASFDRNIVQLFNNNSGIASYNSSTVSKMLTGKTVSVSTNMSETKNGISGHCAPEDIETALQLINLYFTNPRFDAEEWKVSMDQINAILPNMLTTPDYAFGNHLYTALYNSPRHTQISPETVEKANLETYAKYYKQMYKDIAGATLYIVGNVNLETLKPLVEKYAGSLAKGKKASEWNEANIVDFQKGKIQDVFKTTMKTPKATVIQVYSANVPYTLQKDVNFDAASFILDMIYTKTLREEEGGTYGASAVFDLSYEPREEAWLQVYFDTNVGQQEKLRELALSGLTRLATEGPTEEELTRAIENAKKNLPEKRITNGYWMKAFKYNAARGGDYNAEYEAAINNITAEGVKAAVAELLSQDNVCEVVMLPE